MKEKDSRILEKRKQNLARRLRRKAYKEQGKPMLSASNIHYEVSEKTRAIGVGGLGAFHALANRIGLAAAIDRRLRLLKSHRPYYESDHVLNIAFNVLTSGTRLDDIKRRRREESYLDALGAERIPDSSTAGDFLRRFGSEEPIVQLLECINEARLKVWQKQKECSREYAIIDADGTIAPTMGECKRGMGLSYNGIWGYHPLVLTLANTREHLYLVNRPGNVVSHHDAARWIDKAIALTRKAYGRVCLRGDTDFSLTTNFDRWTEEGVDFVFGIDAMANLVAIAEGLHESRYHLLTRKPKYEVKTSPRKRAENVKEQIVEERGYKNIKLNREDIAAFWYRPGKCKRDYRVIVLRKTVSVKQGQLLLHPEVRYFFYVTNRLDLSPQEVVRFSNQRCDHENAIEQLKNGVNALRMPTQDFYANWAYMVMAALAWNMKSWFGLLMEDQRKGQAVIRMEFKRFLNTLINLPCQILRAGRRIIYRILTYNAWLKDFLQTFERIKVMKFG